MNLMICSKILSIIVVLFIDDYRYLQVIDDYSKITVIDDKFMVISII